MLTTSARSLTYVRNEVVLGDTNVTIAIMREFVSMSVRKMMSVGKGWRGGGWRCNKCISQKKKVYLQMLLEGCCGNVSANLTL